MSLILKTILTMKPINAKYFDILNWLGVGNSVLKPSKTSVCVCECGGGGGVGGGGFHVSMSVLKSFYAKLHNVYLMVS